MKALQQINDKEMIELGYSYFAAANELMDYGLKRQWSLT